MSNQSMQTVRRVVVTLSVAAITATGAWYGAGLKSRQEFKQDVQTVREATVSEKLQRLENIRADLVRQKSELQNKIDKYSAKTAVAEEG